MSPVPIAAQTRMSVPPEYVVWNFGRSHGRLAESQKNMMALLLKIIALLATIALGLLSRLEPIGWPLYDKSLGDVLYAVAAYLALSIVTRQPWWIVAPVALFLCEAVECFQATGIPLRYSHFTLVRWFLGTTFAWHDVVCYVVGVAFILLVDVVCISPFERHRRTPNTRTNKQVPPAQTGPRM